MLTKSPSVPKAAPRAGIAGIPRLPAAAFAPKPQGALELDANETRFGASPRVRQAMLAELESGMETHYPAIEAVPLTTALAELHGLEPGMVVAAGGGELLLPLALVAFAGTGDEVVYFGDGFMKFRGYILTSGAVPVPVSREGDAVGNLLAAITPRTRVVLFDNPGNPTGRMLPAGEVARLRMALPEQVLLMLDEAYMEFTDAGRLGLDLLPGEGNVMVFRTLSKAYGLAGLRVGWAAGAEALIEHVKRVVPTFPIPRLTLAGALAALSDQEHLQATLALMRASRAEATRRLRAAGWDVPESQGNFVLVKGGAGRDVMAAHRALAGAAILVRTMPDFCGAPAMRITIGTEAEMARVLAILCA